MINTEEKSKASIIEIMRGINWGSTLLCIISFFVGRVCIFDSFYTLGIAYAGALFFEKKMRRWSSLLTILGVLSAGVFNLNCIKYILVIMVIELLRMGMTLIGCHFNTKNQLLVTVFSLFSMSMISLIFQGFTLYKGIVVVLESAVVLGIMSIIMMAVHIVYDKKKVMLNEYECASVAFLMALILCGLIDLYMVVPFFEKVYLKDILVFMILIGITYLGGIGSGTVVSIIVSSVLIVIGYMPPSFMGVYVFTSLIGGLFCQLERIGIIFAMALGLLLGFALFNNRIIDLPIMGAYLFAALGSMVLPKSYFGMANWFGHALEIDEAHHLLHVQTIITSQLKEFAKSFEGLGKMFEKVGSCEITLGIKEMNQIIEDAGESICKNCTMCTFCWKDYIQDTYKSSYKMLEVLEQKGQILVADIPSYFKKACISPENFAYALSMKLDVFRQDCRWHKKFEEVRGLIAEEFKGISSSVNRLTKYIEEDFHFNKEDENKIKEALQSYGILSKDIMVLEGNGRKQEIHIYCSYKGEANYKEKVIQAAEKALGIDLEMKKYEYFVEDKYCYFKMGAKKQFSIVASACSEAKNGICGDVYSFMELRDGKYLLGVADGMGSGKTAREESETTMELLENFLEAGFQHETALKVINSSLILKSDIECYTTMDIALFDQFTGIVEFLKMGASTSFIVRGNEIITVKASSLPIGILNKVDLITCKKQLKDGDLLIMVTDGILEDAEGMTDREVTFKHFIKEAQSNSPEYVAKFLMNKTKNLMAGGADDDMTIVVARVWKAS